MTFDFVVKLIQQQVLSWTILLKDLKEMEIRNLLIFYISQNNQMEKFDLNRSGHLMPILLMYLNRTRF
jgi:hypothetical protein